MLDYFQCLQRVTFALCIYLCRKWIVSNQCDFDCRITQQFDTPFTYFNLILRSYENKKLWNYFWMWHIWSLIYSSCFFDRPFQKAVRLLLTDLHVEPALDSGQEGAENYKVHFSPVMMGGLPPPTPSLWLHPQADVLPFPAFFPHLYRCLCRLKATDEAMLEVKRGTESSAEKAAMLKQLARSKVSYGWFVLVFSSLVLVEWSKWVPSSAGKLPNYRGQRTS